MANEVIAQSGAEPYQYVPRHQGSLRPLALGRNKGGNIKLNTDSNSIRWHETGCDFLLVNKCH